MRMQVLGIIGMLLSVFLLPFIGNEKVDGLYTEPYPEEQIATLSERLDVSSINTEPVRKGIHCMSVDAAERIAIGTSAGEQKQISVYNSKMEFLFAISFKAHGSFSIVLSEDTVWAFLWRSNLCVGFSSDGTVKEVLDVPKSRGNIEYLEQAVRRDPQIVNGNTYALQNQIRILDLTGEFSRVIVTYEDGEQTVLYDVENMMMASLILKQIGLCLLIALTIGCVCIFKKQ